MTSSDDYIQEGFLAQDRGLWCQKLTSLPRKQAFSPALFLDRDGVVVEEVDYLHRAEDIRLIDGAATIIAPKLKLMASSFENLFPARYPSL